MLACFNRCFELHGTETGRCAEQHEIGVRSDCLLVRVKSDELPFRRDIDRLRPVLAAFSDPTEALVEAILERVGHGD